MRRLLRFALPFAAACAASAYLLPSSFMLYVSAGCAALLIAAILIRWKHRRTLCLVLAGLFAGFGWTGLYAKLRMEPVHLAAQQEKVLTAELSGYPFDAAYGWGADVRLPVAGTTVRARIYGSGERPELAPGDTITGTFRLKPSIKDDGADNALYYQSKGFLLRGSVKDPAFAKSDGRKLRYLPARLAQGLRELLSDAMPEETESFLHALLTGDKSGLSYDVKYDMSTAGISHTVAISGMHVSVLLGALVLLLGRNSLRVSLLGIPLLVLFTLMTGASPSVVRAAVIQLLVLLAPLFRREADLPTSLGAAALLILLPNPYAAADVSFQLSFAAMAGILLFAQPLYGRLRAKADHIRLRFFRWLVKGIFANLSTTLGALAFTTPLIALHFGRFSLYGLAVNLLVLPVIAVCFVGGLVVAFACLAYQPAGAVLGRVLALPVRYVLWLSHTAASLPFASLNTDTPIFRVFLFGAYFLLTACLLLRVKKLWLPALGVAGLLGLTLFLSWRQAQPGRCCVTALDVGQGQCILLRSGDFTAIADCGSDYPEEAGTRAAEYLLLAGSQPVDALIVSHYDRDHAGGVPELLTRRQVRTLYLPDADDPTGTRALLEQTAAQTGTDVLFVREDLTVSFDLGTLTVFAPVSDKSDNDACLSLLFSVPECAALITADLPARAEKLLLQTHALPDTDLYIAGHHGSKSSSCEALLETIRPETVFISVGTNNYGQPSEEALARFAAVGAAVYRTDENGNLEYRR